MSHKELRGLGITLISRDVVARAGDELAPTARLSLSHLVVPRVGRRGPFPPERKCHYRPLSIAG